jgi:hypothetical protein
MQDYSNDHPGECRHDHIASKHKRQEKGPTQITPSECRRPSTELAQQKHASVALHDRLDPLQRGGYLKGQTIDAV